MLSLPASNNDIIMSAIATLTQSTQNRPSMQGQSDKPTKSKKSCWNNCGKKTVCILGGAASGFVTTAAIGMLIYGVAFYALPRIGGKNVVVSLMLGHMLPMGLSAATYVLGIPIGAVLGYRYVNR